MKDRYFEFLYRIAVLVLLSALLYFQIQQRKEIRDLGSVDRSPSDTQDVRVVEWDADPLPITTRVRTGGQSSQEPIPVVVKNFGLSEEIPVRVQP